MTAQKLGETVLVPGVTLSFGREAIFSGLRAIAVTACRRDPPRVEYELTELGHSFLAPLEALVAWADANHPSICNARRDYADGDTAQELAARQYLPLSVSHTRRGVAGISIWRTPER